VSNNEPARLCPRFSFHDDDRGSYHQLFCLTGTALATPGIHFGKGFLFYLNIRINLTWRVQDEYTRRIGVLATKLGSVRQPQSLRNHVAGGWKLRVEGCSHSPLNSGENWACTVFSTLRMGVGAYRWVIFLPCSLRSSRRPPVGSPRAYIRLRLLVRPSLLSIDPTHGSVHDVVVLSTASCNHCMCFGRRNMGTPTTPAVCGK
jgi:hypothetical protein